MFDIAPWKSPSVDDAKSLLERTGVLKRPAPAPKKNDDDDDSVAERMGLRPKAKRSL